MISQTLEKAINDQINAEFWSAYLYLSMSNHFAHEGYLLARDGKVTLQPIAAVDTEWESPAAAFAATLAHEQKVTALINNLNSIAVDEKDFATQAQLQWCITEQVEEEETARDYIDSLKKIGDNGYGLYMFDKELAARTYAAPAPLAGKE